VITTNCARRERGQQAAILQGLETQRSNPSVCFMVASVARSRSPRALLHGILSIKLGGRARRVSRITGAENKAVAFANFPD
jgi:hypothetical protein